MQHRATDWIANAPKRVRSLLSTVREMDRVNVSGRGKTALVASVALVGTGLAGAVTTSIYSATHDSPTTAQVASVSADRNAADRADRATRPEASSPAAAAPVAPAAPAAPVAPAAPAAPVAPAAPAAPAPVAAAPAPKPSWVTPMASFQLSSCYGPRWGTEHQGIDFANKAGTPERAAAAGTVVQAGWNSGGYGNFVIINHGNNTYTLYGHAQKLLVHAGQHVTAGQQISLEGTTGDSQGPHLHFEVWKGMWHRIEPAAFLRSHGVDLKGC